MALFNKLFSSRKGNRRQQDNICEKLFQFNNDHVRVVLFRECDFRGRKLLFDSNAVEKVSLAVEQDTLKPSNVSSSNNKRSPTMVEDKKKKYAEITNGYGYVYTKPNSDVQQLGEMIFGSVAMSYRGTSYKIHSLTSPASIMCTQVFPCSRAPDVTRPVRYSAPGRTSVQKSSSSLDHSIGRYFEDSSTSCTTSFSDQSVHSTASDTLLVCRKSNRSSPLDVSRYCVNIPNPLMRDSGFCCGESYGSVFSQRSINGWGTKNDTIPFSCGSLYKRWLRSASTSLECSSTSLNGSTSTEEKYSRPHPRTKKLGLAVIISYGDNDEERLERYLLEHAVLIEAMMWRLRRISELAYVRHGNFLSLMVDVTASTRSWLSAFLSGPQLSSHAWQTLSSNCDNCLSISSVKETHRTEKSEDDCTLFSVSRFLAGDNEQKRHEYAVGRNKKEHAQKFLRELCELLDSHDIKNTNFFISTLVTAVLTHHLGWVSTAWKPTDDEKDAFKRMKRTGNPLWGQLNDLYGAVGFPTKTAQTVITGSNNSEQINRMLNSLSYFIRCNDIVRKTLSRGDISEENDAVDAICREKKCIPRENYKKYEDHLKELVKDDVRTFREKSQSKVALDSKKNGLFEEINGNSCLTDFHKLGDDPADDLAHSNDDLKVQLGLKFDLKLHLDDDSKEKQFANCLPLPSTDNQLNTLKRMPRSVVSCQNLNQLAIEEDLHLKQNLSLNDIEKSGDVVFVIGDDERLVDLKAENVEFKRKNSTIVETIRKNSIVRNNSIVREKSTVRKNSISKENLSNEPASSFPAERIEFSDDDFVEYKRNFDDVKPSTSWNQLPKQETDAYSSFDGNYSRSRSEPPDQLKASGTSSDSSGKPRFHYAGVKFNFRQHQQIFTNYMRSKNIELSNLSFAEKTMKYNGALSTDYDFSTYRDEATEVEALQTPSNASELEFISEIRETDKAEVQHAKETVEDSPKTFRRTTLPNTVVTDVLCPRKSSVVGARIGTNSNGNETEKLRIVELPMPRTVSSPTFAVGYTSSLFRGANDKYVSDMVLQGVTTSKESWETSLRRDLGLSVRHPLLDQPVDEAVAIIANTDTWEVQLMSSHTYVIDKGTSGVRIGMSQLVGNMLEQLLRMWKLHAPPEHCIMHIEERLQEFCLRSKALAELLLATEFCSMELLTSTLQLEVNDIPLLMAVASTHSPQITQKYGLSFQ